MNTDYFSNHLTVVEHRLANSTIKSYKGCIRNLKEKMTAEEIGEYVAPNGMLLKPLEADLASKIVHLNQIRLGDNGQETFKSKTCCEQYISAMKYWHIESNRLRQSGSEPVIMSQDTESNLKSYASGNRRITVQLRADGDGTSDNGKLPLSFAGYKLLAKYALLHAKTSKQTLLVHSYLILCWNLMARSNCVFNLLWNNVGWEGDCLTIFYEKGKTNQEGDNKVPRHIYANPEDPVICPILALGLKVCSEENITSNTFQIFPSGTADSSFSNWIKSVLSNLSEDEISLVNVPADRIGTHSLRKGGATYVFGVTDGPDSDTVKMRMEHSLGGTDDRYIFRRAGADKYVGRAVCGLDANSHTFSILPPHFSSPTNVAAVIPEGIYSRAGNSLKAAFPYLIASVIYHWDWLLENLPESHPFFTSTIYTNNYKRVWGTLIVSGFFKNEQSGMRSSGIPKYVTVLAENRFVREELRAIPDAVVSKISSVQGVQIYNTEIMDRRFNARFDNIENFIQQTLARTQAPNLLEQRDAFRTFSWGGNFHAFPENFKFPCETPAKIWKLWLFGDENCVNTPYRSLRGEYMSKAQRVQLCRAKAVMEEVRRRIGLSFDEIANLGPVEASRRFNQAYVDLLGHVKFHSNMTCSNAYKHVIRLNRN